MKPDARLKALFAGVALAALVQPVLAQQSKIPPLSQTKMIMEATKGSWIAFRNYNGKQLIYFTQVLTQHCNLAGIYYRLNDETEVQEWSVPECIPQLPYKLDPANDPIYFSQPLGTVRKISVQLQYVDETRSSIYTYVPCDNPGESSCAALFGESQ